MLDLQPSSFEAFEREARQGNVVPVVRSVLADLHTPVGAFMRIAGNSSYSFLLESVEGGNASRVTRSWAQSRRWSAAARDFKRSSSATAKRSRFPASRPSGSVITFANVRSHGVPDSC